MRLTLLGKFVILALALVALVAVWLMMPDSWRRQPRPLRVVVYNREAVKQHEGVILGYVAVPPLAVTDLTGTNPVPSQALGTSVAGITLEAEANPVHALRKVASGVWDAAVVDFPTVVYASQERNSGFRVVLPVSWRKGADRLMTRTGVSNWHQLKSTAYIPATSSEYVIRTLLQDLRLSPARAEKVITRMKPVETLAGFLDKHDAVAGRIDQMGCPPVGWSLRTVTDGVEQRRLMPDVLVVSDTYARNNPEETVNLVRAFLNGGAAFPGLSPEKTAFVKEQAARMGISAKEVVRQMRPAPMEDVLSFMGVGVSRPGYSDLVETQMSRTATGGPKPLLETRVSVDNQPLIQAREQAESL